MKKLHKLLFFLSLSLSFITLSCSSDKDDELLSSEKQITKFTIAEIAGIINQNQKTIEVTLPYGEDITKLKPSYILSDKANAIPALNTVVDFSNPVSYIVTAQDNSVAKYMITVTVEESNQSQFLDFKIGGTNAVVDHDNKTVKGIVSRMTDITQLAPEFVISAGSSISPAIGEPQDFTNPVLYTITAANGTKTVYTVSIETEKSDEAQILSFVTMDGAQGSIGASIGEEQKQIDVTLDYGVALVNLTPRLSVSQGAKVSPTTPQDFTTPVIYTITAESGREVQYTISVTNLPARDISFEMRIVGSNWDHGDSDPDWLRCFGVIDEENKVIQINVPTDDAWDVRYLKPYITLFNGTKSVSPASQIASDFTVPVKYTFTSENGATKEYMVRVNKVDYAPLYVMGVSNRRPQGGEIIKLKGSFAPSGNSVDFISSTLGPASKYKGTIISESKSEIEVIVPSGTGSDWLYDIVLTADNMSARFVQQVYF